MQPADRLHDVQEYYFSQKLKEVRALEAEGKPIINLGIGSPDLPPPGEVVQVLINESLNPENHRYQPYNGLPELRVSIAEFYQQKYDAMINPDSEILPMMGSKEAIMHISMAFLNKGDKVLVPELGYPTYTSVSKLVEADIGFYPLNEDWQPDFEKINFEGVKLFWMNYPHMPSGAGVRGNTFEKVIKLAKTYGFLIIHDNPYSFILNEKPQSILSLDGAKEVCIELNSLSKTFNMSGWRVGWIAGSKEHIQQVLKVKSNMDSGMFKPIQLAAATALKMNMKWYDHMNSAYRMRRSIAEEIFKKLQVNYSENQVGMFLWGEVKNGDGDVLCDQLLYEKSIFMTPGKVFGERGKSYVRLSLCQPEEVLKEALSRL